MKSDVCKLPVGIIDVESLKIVLAETEKTANYANLSKKNAGRLRLLAEELVGMLPEVLEYSQGEFWVECNGTSFELHTSLIPSESLTAARRKKIIELSSSGKNFAATGIMRKIALAAQFMMIEYDYISSIQPVFYANGMTSAMQFSNPAWSLSSYRAKTKEDKGEPWDELEKSIVANIADDVLVGVQGTRVDIIVKKTF